MKVLISILVVLFVIYSLIGVGIEFYNCSQTDDEFSWKNVFTWPEQFLF